MNKMKDKVVLMLLMQLSEYLEHGHDPKKDEFEMMEQLTVNNASTVPRIDPDSKDGQVVTETNMFTYIPVNGVGPPNWPKVWSQCGGQSQSPININTSLVMRGQRYRMQYSDEFRRMPGDLVNNGHAPTFYFVNKNRLLFGVPGLPDEVFVLNQLHFHYGNKFETGSEHAVDGIKFPVELHIAHYNRKYGSFANATGQVDGIVVIAVFIQVGMEPPGELDRFVVSYMGDIMTPDMRGRRAVLNPSVMFPHNRAFYTYVGSLTTPPCNEHVRWVVMRTHKSLSLRGYNLLRSLRDHHGDRIARYGNSRPVQPLGCRLVESTF